MKILAITALLTLPVFADTVELKTGERIDGQFKGANEREVSMDVAGQPVKLDLRKVRAIYLGAPAADSAEVDAVTALRDLKALARPGIAIGDYSARVADARVKVSRFVASISDPAKKAGVEIPANFYEMAYRLMTGERLAGITVFREISENPSLSACPQIQEAASEVERAASAKSGSHGEKKTYVMAIGVGTSTVKSPIQILLDCASAATP